MAITRLAQYDAETREVNSFHIDGGVSISSIRVRTGSRSYSILGDEPFGYVHDSSISQVRVGYWIYHLGSGSEVVRSNVDLYRAQLMDDQIYVRYFGDGKGSIIVERPGTILDEISVPRSLMSKDVWMHIGIDHKIDSSSGWLYVYINREPIFTINGNTTLGGDLVASQANTFLISGNDSTGFGWWQSFVDDIYIDETTGEASPAPPPALRFQYSPANGAGSNAGFTGVGSATNWENVDELPPNGDTDYNEAASAGLVDTFAHAGITDLGDSYTFNAAIPMAFARNTGAGPQIRMKMYDGVNTADGADQDLDLVYDIPVFERMTTQPDGSAWNIADFESAEAGYESRGTGF